MRLLDIDLRYRLNFLGYYQIIGGVIGLLYWIYMFLQQNVLGGIITLVLMVVCALNIFAIYCGNLLRKKDFRGLRLSIWSQLPQIFQFSLQSIAFSYFSGIRFSIGGDWTNEFVPNATISLSGFYFRYSESGNAELALFINLVPLLILYWLNKLEQEIENRKVFIQEELS